MNISFVSCGSTSLSEGIVAVVFSGPELHLEQLACLGWKPLSKEMTITSTDGMLVKSIDGKPAFTIYQCYLGISNDDTFSVSAIEFPFCCSGRRMPGAYTGCGGKGWCYTIPCGY